MTIREGLVPHLTVAQRYAHLVETHQIERDAAQMRVVAALDRVLGEIVRKRPARKASALGWLFSRGKGEASPLRGLYVHGGVGRGKTMLMDLFFELVPARRKRRIHFNAFMADAQDRIQKHRAARKEGKVEEDDPIPPVARALAEEAWVLCFDEFAVTDIADAMILSRLFAALFSHGVVLVATSNVAPRDLYRDGLNRQLFLPFVNLLEHYVEVLTLDAVRDYRQERAGRIPVYLTPLGPQADRLMDEAWEGLSQGRAESAEDIAVKGRRLHVARAAGDAARFSFAELCGRPLAARDYLALTDRFSTIFLDHIPVMELAQRNEAKRFILLIDTLYDRHARLVASAAAQPEGLYTATSGTESFEFARTASRLTEMRSADWLREWSERHPDGTDGLCAAGA